MATHVLHIRSGGGAVTRVAELSGTSARIGRGAQCEIRLADPALVEVECLLRRRGESWQVQPVGPPGRIVLAGDRVDRQQAWPPGVPLEIRGHVLTLHAHPGAVEGLGGPGAFEAPIAVEPGRVELIVPPPARSLVEPRAETGSVTGTETGPPAPSGAGPEAEQDRLARWQARLEQRERWLQARQEERRWASRWRAAGANLRSRPGGTTAARSTGGPEAAELPTNPNRPSAGPASGFTPVPRPEPGRPAEDRPSLEIVTPSPTTASPVATWEEAAPPQESFPSGSWTTPRLPDDSPTDRPLATGPEPAPVSVEFAPEPDPAPAPAFVVEDTPPVRAEASPEPVEAPEWIPAPSSDSPTADRPAYAIIDVSPADRPPIEVIDLSSAEGRIVPPAGPAAVGLRGPGLIWEDVRVSGPDDPAPRSARAAPPDPGRPALGGMPPTAGATSLGRSYDPAVGPPEPEPVPGPDWPRASSIFEGRGEHARDPRPPSSRAVEEVASGPAPTVRHAPEQWTLPFWAAGLPATALAMVVGLVGLSLGWTWACDDRDAGRLADRFLGSRVPTAEEVRDDLGPESGPPAPTWWRSTAGHLFLRALAESEAGAVARVPDPDRADLVAMLLHTARDASPLRADVRYALATIPAAEPRDGLANALGTSRDVLALSRLGALALESGQSRTALLHFGEALAMAAQADLGRLDAPTFLPEPEVRRYALPHEGLIGLVLDPMVAHRGWAFDDWSGALPGGAVAPLAAARRLRALGRSAEGDRALGLALERAQEPAPDGSSEAIQVAAEAEALALRGRWDEAEGRYRLAVDLMPDDVVRRSWWMNLADLYLRLGDDSARRDAWEAARGPDPREEITARAIGDQVQAGIGLAGASRPIDPGLRRVGYAGTSPDAASNPNPTAGPDARPGR